MNFSADEAMSRGVKILGEVMAPYGFRWDSGGGGTSSGGYFVSGSFVRGDRVLELHYRHNLGMVMYHSGTMSIDHAAYMRAVLPAGKRSLYPGFSEDGSIEAFSHLAADLETHCTAFLNAHDDQFETIVRNTENYEYKRGLP